MLPIYYQFKLLVIPPYESLASLIGKCAGLYWYRWQSDCLLETVVTNHLDIPDLLFSQSESWEIIDPKSKPKTPYGIKDITKFWFSSRLRPDLMGEVWTVAQSMLLSYGWDDERHESVITVGFADEDAAKRVHELFVGTPMLTDVFQKPVMGSRTWSSE